THSNRLVEIVHKHEAGILNDWIKEQLAAMKGAERLRDSELRMDCQRFLGLFVGALHTSGVDDVTGPEWLGVREMLGELSSPRARAGLSPSETATFVFSLKQPLFERLRDELASDGKRLADEIWYTTTLIDKLGLFTTEVYQKSREDVILRQQQDIMER